MTLKYRTGIEEPLLYMVIGENYAIFHWTKFQNVLTSPPNIMSETHYSKSKKPWAGLKFYVHGWPNHEGAVIGKWRAIHLLIAMDQTQLYRVIFYPPADLIQTLSGLP